MNVLFLAPALPVPARDGARVRTAGLLSALVAQGAARVELFAVRAPDQGSPELAACAGLASDVRLFERSPAPLRGRLGWPRPARWFHSRPLADAVAAHLASGDVDLIHVDEPYLLPLVPEPGHEALVVHHHKLDRELANATGAPLHERVRLARLEREAVRRADLHVVCADEDATRLRARAPGVLVHAVPNGVDPAAFPPPASGVRATAKLLFLGSLDYAPNVTALERFLRDDLPRIRSLRPDVVLEIVGARPGADVDRLVERAGNAVRLVGEVADVVPYLQHAAALVVPLEIGGGSRLKIASAVATGCPVVTTSVGSEGLGLGDALEPVVDRARFAEAVLATLASPEDARLRAARARERLLTTLTWDVLAGALTRAWTAACAQAAGRSKVQRTS